MTTREGFSTDRAVVVGFGSIGARHAEVLTELGLKVTVVSRRPTDRYPVLPDLEAAVADAPDAYLVIADETARHGETLKRLLSTDHAGPVLVEKPLFASSTDAPVVAGSADRIFVGYNLRFHPLVGDLRQRLAGRQPHVIEAMVGQYLPDWRPARDYRSGYSASRAGGGGVLRDLSHEIDYMLWLFGPWARVAALTGRTGILGVETEEFAQILIAGRHFASATLTLDYLDRNVRRAVTVQHDGGTVRLDFLAGTVTENGEVVATAKPDRNFTYRAQHQAVLQGRVAELCSYAEGLAAIRAIEAVEKAVEEKEWVTL